MAKHFKFFKSSFIALIDRVLVIEEKDQLIKHVYTLLSKFFGELSKTQLNPGKLHPTDKSYSRCAVASFKHGVAPH